MLSSEGLPCETLPPEASPRFGHIAQSLCLARPGSGPSRSRCRHRNPQSEPLFPEENWQAWVQAEFLGLGKGWKIKTNQMGQRITHRSALKTSYHNLTHWTPMETNFRIPTADLFSCGECRWMLLPIWPSGSLKVRVFYPLISVSLVATNYVCCLPPLGTGSHCLLCKEPHRATINASIFQESKQTNSSLQVKLRPLSTGPSPKGGVSAVTVYC